ncbi:hypothetical protein C1H46_004788 [Malus baccata]|uniref:NTF2 domain-containing protein n=1 Tax=Malus baccata TaxID=106549 RepID=A0A540NEV8_MALBA|nr:hypothetical protein C1H46_004788 [Malus baccata]
MATPYAFPVTAAQVGTYFVTQYYQVLQQQPDFVHQFYSEASTMVRADGNSRATAVAMQQIHDLVMSLNLTGFEINKANSLESWNGGVLVLVEGYLEMKTFTGKRKFAQTFFLAPQERGFFVLNDIFHFVDEEPIHQHPAVLLAQNNLDAKLSAPATIPHPVANYYLGEEIQTRDFVAPAVKENGPVERYGFAEQQLQQVVETENLLDDGAVEQSNGSLQSTPNTVQDHLHASVEESIGEPQKQTYASILRVAKGQPVPSVTPHHSSNKSAPMASEWNHYPQSSAQQPISPSNTFEGPVEETADEVAAPEDEGEIKSVYVRNLPTTVSPSEVEEEFVNFGKLKQPEGVVIRSRKRMLVFAMRLLNLKILPVCRMPSRLVVFRLLDDKYTLKSGDQTATSHLEWEEGEEEGAATKQRHQEVVLARGVFGGEVAMMEVTRSTVDRGEMATIGQVLDKTQGTRVINHQEADKIHWSSLTKMILQQVKESFGSADNFNWLQKLRTGIP